MWNRLNGTDCYDAADTLFSEATFQRMLHIERKRSERSKRRFVLMLLESPNSDRIAAGELSAVLRSLMTFTRDTDMAGWYKDGSVIGVIFTELGSAEDSVIEKALFAKIDNLLRDTLTRDKIADLSLSVQMYPPAGDRVLVATA